MAFWDDKSYNNEIKQKFYNEQVQKQNNLYFFDVRPGNEVFEFAKKMSDEFPFFIFYKKTRVSKKFAMSSGYRLSE